MQSIIYGNLMYINYPNYIQLDLAAPIDIL